MPRSFGPRSRLGRLLVLLSSAGFVLAGAPRLAVAGPVELLGWVTTATAAGEWEPGQPRGQPGEGPRDPEEEDGPAEIPPPRVRRAASPYRNPEGSLLLSVVLGAGVGSAGTRFVGGAGVGYAVLTGVVPGVRGLVLAGGGGGVGGELAGTLTLSPPMASYITPFVLGEAGRRWQSGPNGWIYGAGAGVFIGEPWATLQLQVGWIWRWLDIDGGPTLTASAPLVGINLRL